MTDFEESVDPVHRSVGHRLAISEQLYHAETGPQRVEVFVNPAYGRVLAIDGAIQVTERDEFIYHEMIAHVPLFGHGAARAVLVIGGGDGGTIRRVLAHPGVETVTLVDLDASVIDACRRFLPGIAADAWQDPRLSLFIEDGVQFLERAEARWDVIIIDGTDPTGPGAALFTEAFYKACRRALHRDGCLVTQCGVPFLQGAALQAVSRSLARHFAAIRCFTAAIPSYYGGEMAFLWAGDQGDRAVPALDLLARRFAATGMTTGYYSPARHYAAFALPPFIAALLPNGAGR